MLPSHRVRILSSKTNGLVPGVVGLTSVHLKGKEDSGKVRYSDIWIDIGAATKEEAEALVAIGDVVIYGEGYQRLHGTRATARCFDNRIGLYIVAETMRNLAARKNELTATVFGLSSVQEETGLWAARHAGFSMNPTLAIAVDVMPSTDSPGISKELHGDTRVSGGAVIDRGIRTNKKISRMLVATAEEKSIKFQINIENGDTHTDADPISSQKAGIPIGVISAPTRYLHSACEVLDLVDLDHCVNLLTEFILSLKDGMDFRPGV
jgi:endoglucanase